MNKRIPYPYLILFAIQLLLVIIAFKDFRIHPQDIFFCGWGDGLKNYFTLLSYVKWPDNNLFQYNTFNYPFGEFIFTTDNTPLFAIPFKWFCLHIYDLSDYTIPIFNSFIILNLIVCGLLAFAVLRRLLKNDVISFIMSIVLSWTNIQVMRVWRGHFNLSLSAFVVLAIWLVIVWQEQKDNRKKQYAVAAGMIALNYFSFLAHGYYLAIIGMFQSAALFFFGIYTLRSRSGKFSLLASALIIGISFALVFGTLVLTDGFYNLRGIGSDGYDWMEIKLRFGALYTHYDFHSIVFPIKSMRGSYDPENMGYMGNVGLYTFLALAIACVASKAYRQKILSIQKTFFKSAIYGSIFFASLLLLIISFGEHYYTDEGNDGFLVYNFLNPFYFLHQFTEAVTQFRSLGRFAWLFFWAFNIWMLYNLVTLFPALSKKLRIAIIAVMLLLGGVEIKDYVDVMQERASKENTLAKHSYERIQQLKIDYSKYQAMCALPYYYVGVPILEYVLDDYEETSLFSYQLALYSKLPLMNVKLARTVLPQAMMLDSLLAYDRMPEEMFKKFNDKPVLIFLNRKNAAEKTLNNRPVASDFQNGCIEFPQRHNLQPIDSLGDFLFYEWYPKR